MAQMRGEWNVTVEDGSGYHLLLEKNKLTINNEEPVKLTKFKSKMSMVVTSYEIPLGSQTAILHIYNSRPTLTLNGVDCETGQPYEPPKMPAWGWVFVVLYAVNFFVVIGGAIGGAINAGFAMISAYIAANTKLSTLARVFICVAIYVAVTVVSLIIALLVLGGFDMLYMRF